MDWWGQYAVAGARRPESFSGMNPAFNARLRQLFESAPPAIREQLRVFSGYRSPERQAELYQQAVKKYGSPEAARNNVAPPGRSQHNHGNAADLKYLSKDAREWVRQNAGNYGLAFPLGHEPWHIELAGARQGGGQQPAGPGRDIALTGGNYRAAFPDAPAAPDLQSQFREAILATSKQYGWDPVDFATVMSYETGGTFDPWQAGPTTQHGQHRGLIQMGEPQRQKYGYRQGMPISEAVQASGRFIADNGWKPGMGLPDMYSIVNAGAPGRYNATDANNGGAPGTVWDKVSTQMGDHRRKAMGLLGVNDPYASMADGRKGEEAYKPVFGSMSPFGGGQGNDTLWGGDGAVEMAGRAPMPESITSLAGEKKKNSFWEGLEEIGDALSAAPPPPRIGGSFGDARRTGNMLLEVLHGPKIGDALLQKRAPWMFGNR